MLIRVLAGIHNRSSALTYCNVAEHAAFMKKHHLHNQHAFTFYDYNELK